LAALTAIEFMILCSRLNPSSEASSQMETLLESNLDWEELAEKVRREEVGPLLYRNLKRFENRIPVQAKKKLMDLYSKLTIRNLWLFEQLKPLLQTIHDRDLDVAITKGLRLTETLYQSISLRPFRDVDLVVVPEDWPELKQILERLGFKQEFNFDPVVKRKKSGFQSTMNSAFRKGLLIVEVHFNYLGLEIPFSSENDFWKSVQMARIAGLPAKVLSQEYELCYLCLHALQHSYRRLIWLTDIAEISSSLNLDWDKIIDICRRERISAPVFYGLHLVNYLWPKTLSENILEKFKVSSIEWRLLQFFWPEEKVMSRNLPLIFPYYTPTLFSLLARKKLVPALRTLLRIFFPPKAWVAHHYQIPPHSLRIFLHYFWRLSRPIFLVFRRLFQAG